ncbi:twinkle mtDNA helicase-like [Watersipora subatra]|uniref:twinkle mtDNA helicase-like n=1 Tax=Watersipora subatra TaxID=2589382 RepID=UPI00355BD2DF
MFTRCLSDLRRLPQVSDWSLINLKFARGVKDGIKVSESDPVSSTDITQHLQKHGIEFKTGHACLRTTCPRFMGTTSRLDKVNQLYINSTTGYFLCLSCKNSGPWERIRDNITMLCSCQPEKQRRTPACFKSLKEAQTDADESKNVTDLLASCQPANLPENEMLILIELLGMKGIHPKTLQDYKVNILPNKTGVVFPCCDIDMTQQYAKVVEVKGKGVKSTTFPRHHYVGLFGWNLAKNRKSVVLTSSEADAMAVYQATGMAAIALPRGSSTLPQQALPFLESFNKITLWFDNTVQAFENAKTFAGKLGMKRTFVVRPETDSPSALKALRQEKNLKKILDRSLSLVHEHVITFSNHRDDVKHELAFADNVAGVQWKNFPKLNTILKGHRRGELTVFTGGTGSGKTTFLSDYSLDLCTSGVNTLWGSFEINNVRLMKLMVQQYAKKDLSEYIEDYDKWADKFESLSMYYMNYHGHEDIKKVLDTMAHAVYLYDISHVIVDNLQFMMGSLDSGIDRFVRQDQIISEFRRFATKMNCHVTLVIHPRKEDGGALTTNSIFGGAKAAQEADNIIILQTNGIPGSTACTKYLQVTKNRFDGTLGSFRLIFNKAYKSFSVKLQPPALDTISSIPSEQILQVLDENSGDNSQW